MLTFLFSYHQISPSFLDFVFSFGKQIHARHSTFSALRESSRIDSKRKGLEILELGRSGQHIQLCYNLQSVERSSSYATGTLPWAIRTSANYHSFDLKTGHSLWVNVKANKLLKNRITEASTAGSPTEKRSIFEAFSSSLATHLLLCDWSGENWRWYIDDLEEKFRELSGDALAIPIDQLPTLRDHACQLQYSNSETKWNLGDSRSPTLVMGTQNVTTQKDSGLIDEFGKVPIASRIRDFGRKFYGQKSLDEQAGATGENNEPKIRGPENGQVFPVQPHPHLGTEFDRQCERFTIGNLQQLQGVEDKAQEALLVLRHNARVLEELRQHYKFAMSRPEFPKELKVACETDVAHFDMRVVNARNNLQMVQARTETFIHLISNRKNIVSISKKERDEATCLTGSTSSTEFFNIVGTKPTRCTQGERRPPRLIWR